MVVVTWMASVAVHIERTGSSQILHRIFSIMVVTCYAVSLWSISEMFREGETLRDYVTRGYRLDTTWPHINSITLSIISLFAIGGGALLTNRMHLPIRAALVAPLLWVFAFSRSRTGLLALLTIAVFSMKTSTISKGKKLSFVALAMLFIGLLASSTTIRERMRMSSWDELARGAGRIRSAKGNRSGWGETVRLVGKSPAIGYGFVIVKRFVDRDHLAVDNYMLQSLVNAGVIGAGPMICYSCFAFFRWLTRIRLRDPHTRRLAEMGLLATCLGFIKSLTTNGMSVYDISLVLFLFGVLTFRRVIQETIRQENMSLTPQDVEPLLVPVKSRSAY